MDKNLEDLDVKEFLDKSLDIRNNDIKNIIIEKFQEIKTISEKIERLKNEVDEKNLTILLINQNIARLQAKKDALKKEITNAANEPEKVIE